MAHEQAQAALANAGCNNNWSSWYVGLAHSVERDEGLLYGS